MIVLYIENPSYLADSLTKSRNDFIFVHGLLYSVNPTLLLKSSIYIGIQIL